MMRFRGGGVGHKSTREATDFFKKDRDNLDSGIMILTSEDMDIDSDDDVVDEVDEEGDSGVDEGHIDDEFGYKREDSDSADETDEVTDLDGADSDDFGPEDDGEELDPDVEDLGYGVP
jgi:hypothetical protein